MARPQTKRQTSDVQSSLDDSTYDLLSDVSSQISDDDGRTTSVASTDGRSHTADDVTSLSGSDDEQELDDGDDDDAEDAEDAEASQYAQDLSTSTEGDGDYAGGVDSALTARALSEPSIPSASALLAESARTLDNGDIALSHTLYSFEESSMPYAFQDYGMTQLHVVVKQTLSKSHLVVDRPFRLLYVGDRDSKDVIIKKINLALSVGNISGLSKKELVLLSGVKDSSESETLDPYSANVTVEECVGVEPEIVNGLAYLRLSVDGGRCIRFGKKLDVHSLGYPSKTTCLPDLAVFCHTAVPHFQHRSLEWSSQDRRRLARDALLKQDIPVLDVSVLAPFEESPIGGDSDENKNLRMVFEGRPSPNSEKLILQVSPISLEYLLDMDVSRLNRHLACILSETPRQGLIELLRSWANSTKLLASSSLSRVGSSLKNLRVPEVMGQNSARLGLLRIFAWPLLILIFSSLIYSFLRMDSTDGKASILPVLQNIPVSTESPIHSISSLASSSASATPTPISAVSVLSTETSMGQRLKNTISQGKSKSDKFLVQLSEDSHLNITLPKHLAKRRKQPQIDVHITRHDETINWSLLSTSEGRLFIEAAPGKAYGLVNVTIWSKEKPLDKQTTLIDFGSHPWLELTSWTQRAAALSRSFRGQPLSSASMLYNFTMQCSTTIGDFMESLENGVVPDIVKNARQNTGLILYRAEIVSQVALRESKRAVAVCQQMERNVERRVNDLGRRLQSLVPAQMPESITAITKFNPVARARRNGRALLEKIKRRRAQREQRLAERQG